MMLSDFRSITIIVVACAVLGACSAKTPNTNEVSGANTRSTNATSGNTGSDPAAKGPYPKEVADEFVKSCIGAGSNAKFCACMLEKVQDKYSLEEFSVIESKIDAGTPPEEFVEFSGKARAQCLKQ